MKHIKLIGYTRKVAFVLVWLCKCLEIINNELNRPDIWNSTRELNNLDDGPK